MTTPTKTEKKTSVPKEKKSIEGVSSPKLSLKSLMAEIVELRTRVSELESRPMRDRGPDSERKMTEDDARSILLGDLKDKSHKKCAEELKLSYGQIYSSRNGFTFKTVYKEYRDANKA